MSSILPQHAERAFKTYEPYLAQVVSNYPTPTIFNPPSPYTFVARIRDAINGMRLNDWRSTEFTIEDLTRIFRLLKQGGDFVFTQQPEGIYCGPPIKDTGEITVSRGTIIQGLEQDELDARDNDVFNAIYTLKSRGMLPQPITFRNVSDQQKNLIADDLIIELLEEPTGECVLI